MIYFSQENKLLPVGLPVTKFKGKKLGLLVTFTSSLTSFNSS